MNIREETYAQKSEELIKRCHKCMDMHGIPSPEKCDQCYVGQKLRRLETEYSDVTGWSHSEW